MKLKNVLTTIAICISFAFASFGQDTFATAISSDNFKSENLAGKYLFLLPEEVSADEVELSAEFYTVYFKVNFNEENNSVGIVLNGLEEKNRQVIARFFISLGLREIMVEEEVYPVQEFYDNFLKGANSGK